MRALLWFALGYAAGEIACLVLMFVLLPVLHGQKVTR